MRWLARALALLWMTAAAHAGCSLGALPFQLQNGTTADANQVMANFNAILSGAQSNCAELGVNTSITALAGLSSPLTPVLGGSSVFIAGPVTGTANTLVAPIQMPGAGFSLTNGYQVVFTPTQTNTGPAQLNFAGTGLINLAKRVGGLYTATLLGGELTAGAPTTVTYDSVNNIYLLPSNNSVSSGGTGVTFFPPGVVLGNGAGPLTVQSPLSPNNGGTGVSGPTAGVMISLGGNTAMSTQNPLSVANGGTGVVSPNAGVVVSQGANNPMITQSPLSVANGGTGASSVPAAGVVVSNGSALGSQAPLSILNGGTQTANPGNGVALVNGNSTPLYSTSGFGATTQTLHGNPGGTPGWGFVGLTTDVSGVLPLANGGTGAAAITVPTVQVFSSGSATYTPPAGASVVHIRMIAGGGGGAGTGGAGGTGGTTSFGSVTAIGGGGGSAGVAGTGGTGGAGGTTLRVSGASSVNGSSIQNTQATTFQGTMGGTSGTGLGRFGNGGAGGASTGTNTTVTQLAGGGQGEYAEMWLSAATASGQTVTVGGAGAAGTVGGSGTAGAAGIAGLVLVEEFYGLL